MSSTSTAAQLKEEGNRLYRTSSFRAAYDKYSEAIAVDPANAVLFSNRAACSIGLKNWEDVVVDAKKATILDPSFTRAWVRLAEGLKNTSDLWDSIAAYTAALYTLPATNPLPSDLNFTQRCREELKAIGIKATRKTVWWLDNPPQGKVPWMHALEKSDWIKKNPKEALNTSLTVEHDAIVFWRRGLDLVRDFKMPKHIRFPESRLYDEKSFNKDMPLYYMAEGLIRDPRVFYCDIEEFADKLSDKVAYEARQWNVNHLMVNDDPEYMISEVRDLLKDESNWDLARPWLGLWVRHKIVRAFSDDDSAGTPEVSLQDYDRALRVIDWVQTTYRSAPAAKTGSLFRPWYVNNIKLLKMDSLIRLCISHLGPDNPYPPEQFLALAQDVLDTLDATPPPAFEQPGSKLAFGCYTKGTALSAIGLYHRLVAMSPQAGGPAAVRAHYAKSADAYEAAGMEFPTDDEYHVWNINCALEMRLRCAPRVESVLVLCEEIRECVTSVRGVWQYSALWQAGRDVKLERTVELERRLREGVREGALAGESEVPVEMGWTF